MPQAKSAAGPDAKSKPLRLWPALALLALSFAAFGPAIGNGYVNWDDWSYITRNPLLKDWDGLAHIWAGQARIYYPLVYTSFWIEQQLGIGPGGNHAINIVLHGLAAALLWRCLLRLGMSRGLAWLAAAIWTVHPLQVESVIWAVERKNTLTGLFSFAATLAYLRAGPRPQPGWYVAALLLFACALLSKTAFVLLPGTLLLCEWLPRRPLRVPADTPLPIREGAGGGSKQPAPDPLPALPRRGRGVLIAGLSARAALRTLPFFVLGGVCVAATVATEYRALLSDTPPLASRLIIAGLAPWFYLAKFVWPIGAVSMYPRWDVTVTALKFVPLALVALAGFAWLICAARGRPQRSQALTVGLIASAHYMLTLAPTLTIVPYGYMATSFVANHFLYLPIISPIVVAVLLLARVARQLNGSRVGIAAAAVLLVLYAAHSFTRARAWKDTGTLTADILRHNPCAYAAHAMYALELEPKDLTTAIARMRQAVALKPDYARLHYELGRMLLRAGAAEEALDHLREALRIQPALHDARRLLVRELARFGRYSEALETCNDLLTGAPKSAFALMLRGQCYLAMNDRAAAERDFRAAVALEPRYRVEAADLLRSSVPGTGSRPASP